MKKSLFFAISALALSSCDLLNISVNPASGGKSGGDGPLPDHEGVGLNIICEDDFLVARNGDEKSFSRLCLSPIPLNVTTIKWAEGKLTFYEPPIFQQAQLREVSDNYDRYYFEQELVFSLPDNQKADFFYFTDISFSSDNPENKLFKNIRVAILDKESNTPLNVFSFDEKGAETLTTMNLDLNMDGQLDVDEKGELISYTTGMPAYYTDHYDMFVMKDPSKLDNNIYASAFKAHKLNKPLAFRIWVEGWDLTNEDPASIKKIDINFTVAAHKI